MIMGVAEHLSGEERTPELGGSDKDHGPRGREKQELDEHISPKIDPKAEKY